VVAVWMANGQRWLDDGWRMIEGWLGLSVAEWSRNG
jgi:hypothetical protein